MMNEQHGKDAAILQELRDTYPTGILHIIIIVVTTINFLVIVQLRLVRRKTLMSVVIKLSTTRHYHWIQQTIKMTILIPS